MLFTNSKVQIKINDFASHLKQNNLIIEKIILFGSYANGKPKSDSDIDLAVWLKNNEIDHDFLLSMSAKHYPIHPKFYFKNDNKDNDPFIEIIEKTGKQIAIN